MDKKIAVVILNYNTFFETSDCIETILNQNTVGIRIEIIIVDNCSTDGSGKRLRDKWYNQNQRIHYIGSKSNIGFANGMNLGILYAKKNLGIRNILLLNSDIKLIDKDFVIKALGEIESGIGVIGFGILNSREEESYKNRLKLESYWSATLQTIKRKAYLFIYDYKLLYRLWRKIKKNKITMKQLILRFQKQKPILDGVVRFRIIYGFQDVLFC